MSNQAAWIPEARGKLVVKEAPMPQAGEGEVVVRNHAWAINPVEWKIQTYGIMLQSYPNILGVDSAGEVHQVGPGVTHLKKGDRVLAHHHHLLTSHPSHAAFQHFSLCTSLLVQKIPSSLPFKDAAVLPLAISTAANSLYNQKTLRLPYPSLTPPSTPPTQSVLIWGGSGSVGALAIQLASASGVKVVAVCGAQNIENVRGLGAHEVFDYKSPSVTKDIVAALKGTEYLGVADCISTEASAKGWTPVFEELGGRYAAVMPDAPGIPEGVEGATLWAPTVAFGDREIGERVWGGWVPEALEKGLLKAVPPARVVGRGLGALQEAMDVQKKGVSFEKIVVEV